MSTDDEVRLSAENLDLRRLLKEAGIREHEHEATERLQRALLEELHHRIKNTLATVMAIVSNSLRNADSIEESKSAIQSRISALGRAHDLLLQSNSSRASLSAIIQAAVGPYIGPTKQFLIRTVEIELESGAALQLAMILNELCTNALKYGALSAASGRIQIATEIDRAAKRLKLTWTEHGGPTVKKPARRGFGSRLIEFSVGNSLNGGTRFDFNPSGVVCEIDFPLPSITSDFASDRP